jgi:predicted RNA polymerase sigma factor
MAVLFAWICIQRNYELWERKNSTSQDTTLRKDLCLEAMRLTYLLVSHPPTALPAVNALLSLMCFHASRIAIRADQQGEMILYPGRDKYLTSLTKILSLLAILTYILSVLSKCQYYKIKSYLSVRRIILTRVRLQICNDNCLS